MNKNQAAVTLAKARAAKLSPERRSEIARQAAAARLAKAAGDPEALRKLTAAASEARKTAKSTRRKSNSRKD